MFKPAIILTTVFIAVPICSYAAAETGMAIDGASCSFSEWVNAKPRDNSIDENAEKALLREQWKTNLGVDVFYPYFKAKELESKVREKTSVRVLKLKGKPEFKSNEAKYTFTIKF